MTIAVTLEQHLGRNGIAYDVLPHALTTSSLRTVEASHVPADALAKTVVLKGDQGYSSCSAAGVATTRMESARSVLQ